MFRSQNGEDKWIAAHWDKLGLPSKGFFVEFGAGDGVTISNTHWLEHYCGWQGLLCEPDPRHQVNRPNCIVERCCVGPAGSVSLGLCDDPFLSGTLRGPKGKAVLRANSRVEVEQIPLTTLLLKHGVARVDLVSIDTEGTELEAWQTLDLARWSPIVAVIELDSWGLPDRSGEIIEAMRADGYRMVKQTRHNGIFKRI